MAEPGRVAPQLLLCRGCRQFVRHDHALCPFCGGDLAVLQAAHEAREAELDRAAAALRAALGGYEGD